VEQVRPALGHSGRVVRATGAGPYLAVYEELLEAGFTNAEMNADSKSPFISAATDATLVAMIKYKTNPSAYCDAAWQAFGSSGFHKRQMLESK
jgi:hypothetical protein